MAGGESRVNTMDEIRDLLPAYAIGAVAPAERAMIEAALAASPELREELATYAPVMEALALSVPQIAPPPDLGDRILLQASGNASAKAPLAFPWRRFVAVAAVFIAVLVGVLLLQLLNNDESPPETDEIAAIMKNPASSHITLTGQEDHPDFAPVHGELIIAPGSKKAVLHLNNLPSWSQKSYQLWFVGDNLRWSAAVFDPANVTSDEPLLLELPENFASYQGLGITLEPAGGSDAPTGDAVLRATLELPSEATQAVEE